MNPTETAVSVSAPENSYTYFAFVSYKREDEKWARWLKRNLQLYRLPAATHKKHPDLKSRCSPVFLDKTNLMPGDLDSGLASEVQSARYLIVICSRAAKENSKYLDAELKYFLEGSGNTSRVIPFIVDKSDHPVEECFPDYLAELCQAKTIVGVSIYDDGKRSALLRIIAAMLGIKREELESDDLRRRRKQRLAAGLLAFCLLFGAWKCWDYFYPKTAYYVDYTEVYGIPKGIGKLQRSDLKDMNEHYAIISSRGKVRELRCENSAGHLLDRDRNDRVKQFSRALYAYEGDNLSSVELQNKNRHLILRMDYDGLYTVNLNAGSTNENGESSSYAAPLSASTTALSDDPGKNETKRSNIIRYLISYDQNGYTKEIRYAANSYNDFARDGDGISGVRYERDALGRAEKLFYLTFSGLPDTDAAKSSNFSVTGRRDGLAGIVTVHNDSFDRIESRYIDADGNPFLHPAYGCITRSEYSKHNLVRRSFFTAEGEPFLDSFFIAGYSCDYDEHGNEIRRSYFDTDNKPALLKNDYAVKECAYGERGNMLRVSFFGTDGEPVLCKDGCAGWESVFDERGNEIRRGFFGTDGKPILHKDGYAGWESVFDDRGNEIRRGFFGTDGKPILIQSGYAGIDWVFDERGNLIRCSYFGLNGEPALGAERCAGWESVFDDRDNEIEIRYFGTDGKPIMMQAGYAAEKKAYDERGNLIRQSYYRTDGTPTLDNRGVSAATYVHDDRGNIIRLDYFGTDGELTIMQEGYASLENEYNEKGQLIRCVCFGDDGKPILTGEGYAEYRAEYDEWGNTVRISYWGKDGEPTIDSSGVHILESAYDTRGNTVRITLYGTDGRLINRYLNNEYYAVLESEYDERGNCIRTSRFGADGEPVSGCCTEKYEYDHKGRKIKTGYYDRNDNLIVTIAGYALIGVDFNEKNEIVGLRYYGADERPILRPDGYAALEIEYDEKGNIVRRRYLGTDGRLTLIGEHFAEVLTEYDEAGNCTRVLYNGTDGEPVLSIFGYSGFDSEYDALGHCVRSRFFGPTGETVVGRSGYAGFTAEYDALGNQTKVSYFGLNGEAVITADGYTGREQDYNERGKCIRLAYFGIDGQPVNGPDGFALEIKNYTKDGILLNTEYYDESGVLQHQYDLQYSCVAALSQDKEPEMSLHEYYIIVKLGSWEYWQYQSLDERIISDFFDALNIASANPSEVWYLEYNTEKGEYEIFKDVLITGKMGLRILDIRISESDHQDILFAVAEPTEKPLNQSSRTS